MSRVIAYIWLVLSVIGWVLFCAAVLFQGQIPQ
jgi:hypothetical protein